VGANIQIYNDISYSTASGDTPSLVIIVQKDSGGTGGNVYVDPSVTKINATIIADGALMNGISGTPQNWLQNDAILNSRLQINGKLLTYNTR